MSTPEGDPLQLIGTTIAEKYAVEAVVGEGGFAVVYRAQHTLWKRPVAVKVFKALEDVPVDQRSHLLDGFIREGALLAELSERSSAICQARDIGMLRTARGGEIPYMVLEWLEGASLEAVLDAERARGERPRTVEEAVRLVEPAGQALAIAHTKGVAHRDVKPANIFVLGDARSPEATVKLLDFGIAKVVQDAQKMAGAFSKTSGQITSFTPAYGAPEQFSRAYGATGPWTDVFALALVLVEVLTQRAPLDGEELMQLAFASSNPASRPTPRALGAVVSDAVESVFARALAVKPDERYATAGDFWNALRGALSMQPLRMSTATDLTNAAAQAKVIALAPTVAIASDAVPARPPARRRATLAIGGAVVAAVGVAGAAFVLTRGAKEPERPRTSASASSIAAPRAIAREGMPCPHGMREIPGGEFFMGSDDDLELEKPAHHVKLSPFCIDTYEVTVERYKACSDRGACKRASHVNEWPGITKAEQEAYDPLCTIRDPVGKARHPINCVDWEMAATFCASEVPPGPHGGGRLPTEAEWEFAARGPDGRKFPWGDEMPSADRLNACGAECVAWGKKNKVDVSAMYPDDDGYPNTAPVGSFPKGKSRYGVEDVVGNVWEWVADLYAPYPKSGTDDMAMDPKGPSVGTERVVRGGAWNGAQASWVRPTFRFHDAPTKRGYGVGFRCARSL